MAEAEGAVTTPPTTPPAEGTNTGTPAEGAPPVDGSQTPAAGEAGTGKPGEGSPPPSTPSGDVLDTPPADGAQPPATGDVLSGDDNSEPEGVPDQYTFDPPEGFTPNQEALDAAMAVAKEAGLTQAQFDAIAKFDIERTQAANDQAVEDWNNRVQGWRDSAKADKEFGGQNYNANVATALTAVEKFGDAEFKALLKSPSEENPEGLAIGNHPAVLRFLNRIGKVLGDPTLILGDETNTNVATDADRLKKMYPSMFKED